MFSNILGGAAGFPVADLGDEISQSLRFRGSHQSLTRTPGSASNRKTFTWSLWVKRGALGSDQVLLSSALSSHTSGADIEYLMFQSGNDLRYYGYWSSAKRVDIQSNARFRDTSAWYHIVVAVDTTQSTSSDRAKLYVNGTQITDLASSDYPAEDFDMLTNNNCEHKIGEEAERDRYDFDGYMAEIHLVDGTQLAPTDFGKFNEDGVWVPQRYTGSHGTNGFYLPLDSSAGLGDDASSNTNDLSASGFETTAISSSNFDNDVDYNDTPTSNYPTFNPLATSKTSVGGTEAIRASETHDGNLHIDSSGQVWGTSTMAVESGKWYFEVESNHVDGYVGIHTNPFNSVSTLYYQTPRIYVFTNSGNGRTVGPTWATNITTGLTQYGDGDIVSCAVDIDAGEVYFAVNGTWQNSADPAAGTNPPIDVTLTGDSWTFGGGSDQTINYGQRPFRYTPPTGFKALHANNLPEPTIKNSKEHFAAVTYTGNASGGSGSQNISLEFQPDLVWIKARNSGYNNNWFDSVRGTSVRLRSNMANPDDSMTNGVTAFNSDGFTVGDNAGVNDNNVNYVAWCWKAGGTAVSNTNGTITSSVSANTDAGFSIVSYHGNDTAGATVGHGLNSPPECIIVKNREESSGRSWQVYHIGTDDSAPEDKYLQLDSSGVINDSVDRWNDTAPTSTVFSLGDSGRSNANDEFIAYCWHSVEGFSKIGSYTGNGLSSVGPFIYTGFSPAWLMIKGNESGAHWIVLDTARDATNPTQLNLKPSADSTESNSSGNAIDLLSNGFKLRGGDTDSNLDGKTYVYMAFAERPFGGENAAPATAR